MFSETGTEDVIHYYLEEVAPMIGEELPRSTMMDSDIMEECRTACWVLPG